MSLNAQSLNAQLSPEMPNHVAPASSNGANHVVLMVADYQDARAELKLALKLKGYRVIDTDTDSTSPWTSGSLRSALLITLTARVGFMLCR
jgi:hypothetical protein